MWQKCVLYGPGLIFWAFIGIASTGYLGPVNFFVNFRVNVDSGNTTSQRVDEDDKAYHERRMAMLDGAGWTDLHRAAVKGDVAEVQRLLASGQPVDPRGNDNETPLYEAARRG